MNGPLGLRLWPPIMVGGSISDSQRALHCHLTQAAGVWVSTLRVTILKSGQYSSNVQAGCLLLASSTASSPRGLNLRSFNIRVFDIGNPNFHLSYAPVIGEFWNQLKIILMWCAYI